MNTIDQAINIVESMGFCSWEEYARNERKDIAEQILTYDLQSLCQDIINKYFDLDPPFGTHE